MKMNTAPKRQVWRYEIRHGDSAQYDLYDF